MKRDEFVTMERDAEMDTPLRKETTENALKGVRTNINGRVDTVMKKTWITDMANRHCGKLSKGYKQRVGLAQALIHEPEVLVLDEPTAGLDPKQIIEVRQLIRELAGSHTIVLSTHILPEVAQTCQKVVIINRGKIVATDTPEALTDRLRGAVTTFVQAQGPIADVQRALQGISGVVRVNIADVRDDVGSFDVDTENGADVRRSVADAIVRGGWGLLELRPTRISLEDVFLKLTTEEPGAAEGALPSEAAGMMTGSEGGANA